MSANEEHGSFSQCWKNVVTIIPISTLKKMPIQRLLQLVENFTFSRLWRRLTKIKAVFDSDVVQSAAESSADDKTELLPAVSLWENQGSQNSHYPCAVHAGDGSCSLCFLEIKIVRSNTNQCWLVLLMYRLNTDAHWKKSTTPDLCSTF